MVNNKLNFNEDGIKSYIRIRTICIWYELIIWVWLVEIINQFTKECYIGNSSQLTLIALGIVKKTIDSPIRIVSG